MKRSAALATFSLAALVLCAARSAEATLARIAFVGPEETLGAHEFRGGIATDSANQPHVVTTDGTSAHFYDKIGGTWRAEFMSSGVFNSSQYGNPEVDITADQAWYSGVLWGGTFGFGVIFRQNILSAPTPVSTALKTVAHPSPGVWDAGNISLDPAFPNRAIVSSMAGYWMPVTYTGSGLSVGGRGQMYAGEGGEKNAFWISKAGNVTHGDGQHAVWHGAMGGFYGYWSAYRNSLMGGPVTWASEPAYPAQNDDGAYVNVTSDNVTPQIGYIVAAYAGITMNIWDGAKMVFPTTSLLQVDPAGGVTSRRYPPRLAPAKYGGVFVCWTRGGTLMIRYVSPDGAMGDEVAIGPGAPGDICVDSEGNVHVYYVNNGAKYRKIEVLTFSRWITQACDYNADDGAELSAYDTETGDWYIRGISNGVVYALGTNWGSKELIPAAGDYDGNGIAEFAVYDPAKGDWYIRALNGEKVLANGLNWGGPGALPVPGDYDGDGADDLMVYYTRSGEWFAWSRKKGRLIGTDQWGGFTTARPIPGDFNGDGRDDLAVWDTATGDWYIKTMTYYMAYGLSWGWGGATTLYGDYDGDGKDDLVAYDIASAKWYIRSLAKDKTLRWGFVWGFATTRPVAGDFDGDKKDDLAVYDTATGDWHIIPSAGGGVRSFNWGSNQSVPVPGDYDGDGKTDAAVFHTASGTWFVLLSSNGQSRVREWGWSGTVAVPGDFDKDGRADFAVYHPPSATWYVLRSGSGKTYQKTFGPAGAIPFAADVDGDGSEDLVVYDVARNQWHGWSVNRGRSVMSGLYWGFKTGRPHPGDFDGDKKADLGLFDTSSGLWYIMKRSENLLWKGNWGWNEAIPLSGDYDGDGRDDMAIYDPVNGDWYIRSIGGTVIRWDFNWGSAGLIPVAGDYTGDGRADLAVYNPLTADWFIMPYGFGALNWGFTTTVPMGSSSW